MLIIIIIIIIIKKNFFSRFDQVFMLVLEQLQPLCVSEEKFCTTFFHFPRAEETRGVSEGGREGGREGREGREGRKGGGRKGREGGREGREGGYMCKVGNNCDK